MTDLPFNPDADAYRDGLGRGVILMQTCAGCGRMQFPARVRCMRCGSAAVELAEVDGAGAVYAKTVSRRAPEEAFSALVPYAVALVDLDVGVRVVARADVVPDEVHTGSRVLVYPDPEPPVLPGLLFRPIAGPGR
jgi:uncharacterized OB-fold protein